MNLGEKIRRIRHLKALKQETLADKLGMSVNGYGKIERNEGSISVDRLVQIAHVLEVDIKYILDFETATSIISSSNLHIEQHPGFSDGLPCAERRLYEENIASLKELIKLKDEVIAELKSKL